MNDMLDMLGRWQLDVKAGAGAGVPSRHTA